MFIVAVYILGGRSKTKMAAVKNDTNLKLFLRCESHSRSRGWLQSHDGLEPDSSNEETIMLTLFQVT